MGIVKSPSDALFRISKILGNLNIFINTVYLNLLLNELTQTHPIHMTIIRYVHNISILSAETDANALVLVRMCYVVNMFFP